MKIVSSIDASGEQKTFSQLKKSARVLRPALLDIGDVLEASVDQNFKAEGRPIKWKKLKPATIKARRQSGPQILNKTGELSLSVVSKVKGNTVEIGSPLEYARIHNQGGTINHPGGTKYKVIGKGKAAFLKKEATDFDGITKPHKIKIPARPFLLFQKEDIVEAKDILQDHLLKGIRR